MTYGFYWKLGELAHGSIFLYLGYVPERQAIWVTAVACNQHGRLVTRQAFPSYVSGVGEPPLKIPVVLLWSADCCLLFFSCDIRVGNPGFFVHHGSFTSMSLSNSNVHTTILNVVTLGIRILSCKFQGNKTSHARMLTSRFSFMVAGCGVSGT